MFWRLTATYGLLLLGAIGLLGLVLDRNVEQRELEQIKDNLLLRARLAEEVLRGVPANELQQRAEALARQDDLGLRITLIARDGRVLADSARDPENFDNHAGRPEVVAAGRDGFGSDVRRSASINQMLMYVAVRARPSEAPVAYVRVARSLGQIQTQLAGLRQTVATTAAVTLLAALGLAAFLSRRLARPIQEVTRAAEEIADGRFGQKVYAGGGAEVGRLAHTFNRMSDRLAGQIAQLEQDQQQLRAILGGMVEGVVALDAEQRILFANERAGHLLDFAVAGFTTEGAVGRKLWDVVRQRGLLDLVGKALTRPKPQRREMNWNALASRSITVHAARLPGTPPRGAVLVVHDTSELRRLERLRQEFAANVSHELKTPLTVIKASVETLLDGGAADDPVHCRPFLERVAEQSERLHRLILDLLSLARIETGSETFVLQNVSVGEAVDECLERQRPRAEAKNQTLEWGMGNAECGVKSEDGIPHSAFRIPHSHDVWAWADEDAIGEILDNLIDNAVKYTPVGGSIRVRCWGEDDWACLEVADNGIGIPDHDLPRIFERFYRVDKARSRELGGTGLGLSIVKHLVQAMRGSITASSEVGRGTTFSVRLPRQSVTADEQVGTGEEG
jgi:two-component system, OmpR family, phosphate regulon sensor histidine kinase PhoR